MRTFICLLLTHVACNALRAQPFWSSANLPGYAWTPGTLAASADGAALYYAGVLSLGASWELTNKVIRYHDGQWDTLPGVVPGQIFTILEFHDTLFIGGQFQELNGLPSGRVAYHDGSAWRPYGNIQTGAVRRLRVLNDTLYAMGNSGLADGSPMKGVSKRVGSSWQPVGQISDPDPNVGDLALYNGELVMASNATVGNARSLFRLVDGQWLPLGGGIQGGLSAAGYLEVLHGRLYIGGQFSPAQGNAGKDVMYWDGEAFHPMGSGIQNNPGNNGGICTGALSQHDGKLWVNHGCYFAGGIESKGMAYWDGIQWCGVPGDLASYAGGAYRTAWYRDTLFVTLYGDMADGVQTGRVAKFVGSSYEGQCSGPVGLPAPEQPSDMLRVTELAPNQWRLDGLKQGTYTLCIYDALGRVVARSALHANAGLSDVIGTGHLTAGTYLLCLLDVKGEPIGRGVKLTVSR